MKKSHVKYVLVGGGVTASSAADAIREVDGGGAILMVGQEVNRAYHRPLLAREYLQGKLSHEQIFAHVPKWYAEKGIQLRTGRRVAQLDCVRQSVALDDGQEVSFEKLLLATGAGPRHLSGAGHDWPNVHYLRTIDDADRLRHGIDAIRREVRRSDRGRAAVIGAGPLGIELAASLSEMGLSVDLFCAGAHPLHRFAGEVVGRAIQRHLEGKGVRVHTQAAVSSLQGDGRVQRIVTTDGKVVVCDLVAVAVGISIQKDLLRGTAIAAERAILVDEHCQTSIPDIFAAGDCCAVMDPTFGKHRLLDHHDASVYTGRLAGVNMAGGLERFDYTGGLMISAFDVPIRVLGEARLATRRIVRTVAASDMVEIGVSGDGRIVSAVSLNHEGDQAVLKSLIRARANITGWEEWVKDPAKSLDSLMTK